MSFELLTPSLRASIDYDRFGEEEYFYFQTTAETVYCLEHECFNLIMSYLPAYPYLHSLRRINKIWKRELESRVFDRVEYLDLIDRLPREERELGYKCFNKSGAAWLVDESDDEEDSEDAASSKKKQDKPKKKKKKANKIWARITRESVLECMGVCYPNVTTLRVHIDDSIIAPSYSRYYSRYAPNDADRISFAALLRTFPKLYNLTLLLDRDAVVYHYRDEWLEITKKLKKLEIINCSFSSTWYEDYFWTKLRKLVDAAQVENVELIGPYLQSTRLQLDKNALETSGHLVIHHSLYKLKIESIKELFDYYVTTERIPGERMYDMLGVNLVELAAECLYTDQATAISYIDKMLEKGLIPNSKALLSIISTKNLDLLKRAVANLQMNSAGYDNLNIVCQRILKEIEPESEALALFKKIVNEKYPLSNLYNLVETVLNSGKLEALKAVTSRSTTFFTPYVLGNAPFTDDAVPIWNHLVEEKKLFYNSDKNGHDYQLSFFVKQMFRKVLVCKTLQLRVLTLILKSKLSDTMKMHIMDSIDEIIGIVFNKEFTHENAFVESVLPLLEAVAGSPSKFWFSKCGAYGGFETPLHVLAKQKNYPERMKLIVDNVFKRVDVSKCTYDGTSRYRGEIELDGYPLHCCPQLTFVEAWLESVKSVESELAKRNAKGQTAFMLALQQPNHFPIWKELMPRSEAGWLLRDINGLTIFDHLLKMHNSLLTQYYEYPQLFEKAFSDPVSDVARTELFYHIQSKDSGFWHYISRSPSSFYDSFLSHETSLETRFITFGEGQGDRIPLLGYIAGIPDAEPFLQKILDKITDLRLATTAGLTERVKPLLHCCAYHAELPALELVLAASYKLPEDKRLQFDALYKDKHVLVYAAEMGRLHILKRLYTAVSESAPSATGQANLVDAAIEGGQFDAAMALVMESGAYVKAPSTLRHLFVLACMYSYYQENAEKKSKKEQQELKQIAGRLSAVADQLYQKEDHGNAIRAMESQYKVDKDKQDSLLMLLVLGAETPIANALVKWLAENHYGEQAFVYMLLNVKTNDGDTVLHCVADHIMLRMLLEGAGEAPETITSLVGAKNNDGETPLFVQAANGRKDCMEILLAFGADRDAESNNGETPNMRIFARPVKKLKTKLITPKNTAPATTTTPAPAGKGSAKNAADESKSSSARKGGRGKKRAREEVEEEEESATEATPVEEKQGKGSKRRKK